MLSFGDIVSGGFLLSFFRRAALATILLVPGPALAEGLILVSDPLACGLTEGSREVSVFKIVDAGHLVLQEHGIDGFEYTCEFERPIAFDWADFKIDSRSGYCNEPGFLEPGVFAMMFTEPGEIIVHATVWDEPIPFRACPR